MATVTMFTAERMQEIEDAVIDSVEVVNGDILFTRNDGTVVNAGAINPTLRNFVPIVTKHGADIVISAGFNAWTDVDPFGNAAARPLDVVIPDVEVDDWVDLGINLATNAGAGTMLLDFFTIVAGAPVHSISGATKGVPGWICAGTVTNYKEGSYPYQIQPGDIEGGNARFRLRYNTSGAKSIFGLVTNYGPITCIGRGPFR